MSSQSLDTDVSSLIRQLIAFRHKDIKDEATRRILADAARGLAVAIETPRDTVQRIAFSVRFIGQLETQYKFQS